MSLPRISSHTKPTSSSSETMTMSTTITAVRLVIARVSVLAAAIVVLAGIIATPSRAQPVDFVKICSLYGAGFFYTAPSRSLPSRSSRHCPPCRLLPPTWPCRRPRWS
jgi:hypothetical protein